MKKPKILAVMIIARSGAGKGTVAKVLISFADIHKEIQLKLSVSDTTRPQKDGEINGIHYNFISLEEFQRRKEAGYYIETDYYAGNWYGSPHDQFFANKSAGIITLYDVEANGAEAIQQSIGKDACLIFRLHVPLKTLDERVLGRNRDTPEEQGLRKMEDVKRTAKMIELGTPIEYGEDVLADAAANEMYNAILAANV